MVTFFPYLINIFSLFSLQGFPCFPKNSDLKGFPCIDYNFLKFQLQGFLWFKNTISLFCLHYFPVLLTFFPCLIYRVFPVLLKIQIYRDFPVLVTTILCFKYRVFPAFITPFLCFGYIISLYWLQLFFVSITGFPCFYNTFFLFWLHYVPVLLMFFPCLIYRASTVLVNFNVVVFQRTGKSLL